MKRPTITIEQMRAYAVRRSLFPPDTLQAAIQRLGYVQADPIRAPARAQDLILRHRVKGYRAGNLELAYPTLDVEEDCFVNYGFVPRAVQRLMHPRQIDGALRTEHQAPGLGERVLAFVRKNGPVHPKEVQAALGRQSVANYWGSPSSATTHVLDALHYRGLLRVARRDAGVRVYEWARHLAPLMKRPPSPDRQARRLVQLIVNLYAPLPESSLRQLVSKLRYGAPQLDKRHDAIEALLAGDKLKQTAVDGVNYVWPAKEHIEGEAGERVSLLSPFDPVVWDRRRFKLFWDWDYRLEAYTPPAKRKLGYYALPLLWRDDVIGWANLKMEKGSLNAQLGFAKGRPKAKSFQRALEAELARMRRFLGVRPT